MNSDMIEAMKRDAEKCNAALRKNDPWQCSIRPKDEVLLPARVLQVLGHEPVTVKQLCETLGTGEDATRAAVNRLVGLGKAEKCGTVRSERGGRSFTYRIAP